MHQKFDINTYFEELVNSNLYNNNKIEQISRPSVLYKDLYQEPPKDQLLYAKFLKDNYSKEIKPPIVRRDKHAHVFTMGPVEVKPMPRSSSTNGVIDLISDHVKMEALINNTISDQDKYSSTRQTKEFPMPRTFGPDSLRHARTYSSYDSVDLTEVFNRENQVANSVVGGRSRGYGTFGDYPISSIGLGGNPCEETLLNSEIINPESLPCLLNTVNEETMSQQHYYLDLLEQTTGAPLYAITFHPEKGKPALYRTGTCYLPYFIDTNRNICNFLTKKYETHLYLYSLDNTNDTVPVKINAVYLEFSPKLISFMKNALWYKEFGGFPLQDVLENTTIANAPDLLEGL